MSKKGNKQNPEESEETSVLVSWTESNGEEYTRTTSNKGAHKGKAQLKAKRKRAVPQESDTPPPKGLR